MLVESWITNQPLSRLAHRECRRDPSGTPKVEARYLPVVTLTGLRRPRKATQRLCRLRKVAGFMASDLLNVQYDAHHGDHVQDGASLAYQRWPIVSLRSLRRSRLLDRDQRCHGR